jgi:hypothetical protein
MLHKCKWKWLIHDNCNQVIEWVYNKDKNEGYYENSKYPQPWPRLKSKLDQSLNFIYERISPWTIQVKCQVWNQWFMG